jgi:hypothetical protein
VQNTFTFTETSPAAPGTAASSAAITSSDLYHQSTAGVAIGSTQNGFDKCNALSFFATLIGATGGVLDVYVQTASGPAAPFVDIGHFPQLTAGQTPAVKYNAGISLTNTTLTPIVVGSALVPALAANNFVPFQWGDRFRLVFVAGASTTVGAAVSVQITASRYFP